MNTLARVGMALELVGSIVISIFLIGFFGYLTVAGTAWAINSVRNYGKKQIRAVA